MNRKKNPKNITFFDVKGEKLFGAALVVAILLHTSVIFALVVLDMAREPEYQTLAIMDFSPYDPLGGEPGGAPPGEPINQSPSPPPAKPESIPPEPEEVSESEQAVVTTTAKAAVDDVVIPPKKEKPKEKRKPKREKPRERTTEQPAENTSSPVPSQLAGTGGSQGNVQGSGTQGGTGAVGTGQGKGQGGSGGGTGQGNPDALKAYHAQIRKKLERYQKYPRAARSRRQEGVVTVFFVVNRNGTVVASKLVKSSDHRLLNDEAIALLKRVNPFPPIPKEVHQDQLDITIPIRFKLVN
ncbi:energy transducer TonB [Desulfosarcina sp. OttesenSCG-928-A07]|nr:energy transducer TonB [Desulfosarcina sp. OttesenSCG-928-G17]MDL2329647.1 energy transducer TonB [Desulfosarcina sp. OttesenSCG-928-A07]